MKITFLLGVLALVLTSAPAFADSLVRVQCEDEDAGAEVYLNDKFVGECPVDAPVREGTVLLRARKAVGGDHEKVFEKKLRVVDGVSQRVEIALSPPKLTAEAVRRNKAAETAAQLRSAQDGNIAAMKEMARRYTEGVGVAKNPTEAAAWSKKAEATAAHRELALAQLGDIEAMRSIAGRYESGVGIEKSHAEAESWRNKLATAEREKRAEEIARADQEKAREKQSKIDSISFFKMTKMSFDLDQGIKEKGILYLTAAPFITVLGVIFDLFSAPSVSTEIGQLKDAAALHPSTWGNPDSLIAKASRQQKTVRTTAEMTLLLAEAK
jgi:hypothetical protein